MSPFSWLVMTAVAHFSVGDQFVIYSQIGIYSKEPRIFYNGKIIDTHCNNFKNLMKSCHT